MNLKNINKFNVMIIILVMLIQLTNTFALTKSDEIVVKKGYIDASKWNFDEGEALPLSGEWEFYWNSLLEPKDFEIDNYKKSFIHIPTDLVRKSTKNNLGTGDGYATLRLKIKVRDINKVYGLKFKYFSSANKIWVNGVNISSSGKVGIDKETYKSNYIPQEILFKSDSEDIEIVVQIANFHHRRIRLNEVLFGTADQIQHNSYMNIIKESILIGSLLLVAVYCYVVYFIKKREPALLYLSLTALLVAVREAIVSERILIRVIPNLSAEIMMKLGYLPVFVLLPLISMYIREIFKSPKLDNVVKILKYIGFIFFILIMLTTVKVYDWIFEYGSWLIVVAAIYIIYIIIYNNLIKSTRRIYTMVAGCGAILITAINDIFRELGLINTPELLSVGFVLFVLFQAIFLAWRFNDSYDQIAKLSKENEEMYKKIQELNEDLETRIKSRTKELQVANRKLAQMSKIDPLTGLGNRRYFDEQFKYAWNKSLNENKPISIIMMDIDYFKSFNDSYGHLEGDKCLKKIADTIKSSIREKADIVARYGGEEFVALFSETDSDMAAIMAERIRRNIKSLKIPHRFSCVSDYITISLGVNTIIASEDDSMNEFIRKADRKLYIAKEKGRDNMEAETASREITLIDEKSS